VVVDEVEVDVRDDPVGGRHVHHLGQPLAEARLLRFGVGAHEPGRGAGLADPEQRDVVAA
jgi:hypothetical protein